MDEKDYVRETKDHIFMVQRLVWSIIPHLNGQVAKHDASKLDSPEKEAFMKAIPKLKDAAYGSDEYKEALKDIKPATDHHNAVNRHHIEHHKDGVLDMSLIDIIEMLADWKAASTRHKDGDIIKSIDIGQNRFGFSDELAQILKNTAIRMQPDWDAIAWEGGQLNSSNE